jgi:hypothetical protein
MTEFQHPLSPEDRQRAAALLRSGQHVHVGDYRLYADDGFIEADDAYGQPVIWSASTAPEDALRWVDRQTVTAMNGEGKEGGGRKNKV